MTLDTQPTATIHPFPSSVRSPSSVRAKARRFSDDPKTVVELRQVPIHDCGAGWYHEAAIREADRTRTV